MNKSALKNYAKLLATVGVNIKKGQEAVITADLDQPEFVAMCVEALYKAGASSVTVEWGYGPLAKIHTKHKSVKELAVVREWELAKMEYRSKSLPAMLHIVSADPDGKKGIDQEKTAKANKLRYPLIKPYRDKMDNKYQWCIAAVPGERWAKKIFPELSKGQAVKKLWEAILQTSRAYEGDAVENWAAHNANLKRRYDKLNAMKITTLEYKSGNGTDFSVGLMKNYNFEGGMERSLLGNEFNPNIPSEEIFASPKRGVAEGIVYSTKPLSYNGELINNFSVRFHEGKAVEVKADTESGTKLLQQMITMDEGAAYLGEVALVDIESPVNKTGILFYNTLFDENASCHLALGNGFAGSIKDYDKYTKSELREMGLNESMIHVDFMIGSPDLSIVAVTERGERVQIFKNGLWTI